MTESGLANRIKAIEDGPPPPRLSLPRPTDLLASCIGDRARVRPSAGCPSPGAHQDAAVMKAVREGGGEEHAGHGRAMVTDQERAIIHGTGGGYTKVTSTL